MFADGLPLRILAIGGSLTCGAANGNVSRGDRPSLVDAWPALLEAALKARVPSSSGEHRVVNVCRGAVASDFWVDQMAAWLQPAFDNVKPLLPVPWSNFSFDLVIVETAINDVEEFTDYHARDAHLRAEDRVRKYSELLVLQLLRLEPRPALMWLTASSRDFAAPSGAPRSGDSQALHQPIMQHYRLPLASTVDALGVLDGDFRLRQFWEYDFQ